MLVTNNYLGFFIIKDEASPCVSMMHDINDVGDSISYLLFSFIGLFFKVSSIFRIYRIILSMLICHLFYFVLF